MNVSMRFGLASMLATVLMEGQVRGKRSYAKFPEFGIIMVARGDSDLAKSSQMPQTAIQE